ncbi:CpsB/CapC family capsule biosynthesis tyrosine phosphatase [Metabacillus sp. FJAT-52054]|uniref:Tyrosine-protein phosphatase n=1 Tax=Metabacillus sediminis TaxID=3117746 RepID=A0ABZ2NCU0_9BACI
MMIDLSSSILSSEDESLVDFQQAFTLAKQAYKQEINHILIIQNISGKANIENYNQLVKNIKLFNNKLLEEKMEITIRPGIKLIYSDQLDKAFNFRVESLTINKASKYLLVEIPAVFNVSSLESFFYKLQIRGIVPIISNAEKVKSFQMQPEILYELVQKSGALIQISANNIFEGSDPLTSETAKIIIQSRLVHLLASSAQHPEMRPYRMTEGYTQIEKWTSPEYVEYLKQNAHSVWFGHYFPIYQPLPFNKKPLNHLIKFKTLKRTSSRV